MEVKVAGSKSSSGGAAPSPRAAGRGGPDSSGNGSPAAVVRRHVAVGTAAMWAVIHGYLSVLLRGPPLSERMPKDVRGKQVPRLLILCPSDGRLPEDIGRLHERLVPAGRAQPVIASVAGARSRPYGDHPVFQLHATAGGDADDALLVAVESASTLRTLHVVAEAMAQSRPDMPPLDVRRLVRQFIRALQQMVESDAAYSSWVRVVVYDPARDAEESLLPALMRAAEDTVTPAAPHSPASPARLPLGVGVYLAWSFFHGYLALVTRRRDTPAELAALGAAVRRVVLLCPLEARWTDTDADDLPALDAQLQPVRDVSGVESGVPALAGRSYGNYSIYRVGSGGGCFALELATPLRTLSLGAASEGVPAEVYRTEARAFTDELRALLHQNPTVGAHFAVLEIEELANIHEKLSSIA